MVRVFANGPGDLGSIPGRVIPKSQKMVLNSQHYKVRVKWSNLGNEVAPSPTLRCNSYRNGSLRVTLDFSRQSVIIFIGIPSRYFDFKICTCSSSPLRHYWNLPHALFFNKDHHLHHQVLLLSWVSLTLSHHLSLSSIAPGRSFMLHPVSV